ncbi:hypothetical protein DMH26_00580 [Streptomyces sp. WAC 05379]|uniref:hypothetical protein n=1 Tax=Streptomyces sp. WAC 05379 TaxID=2203207 RepID=UPI000F73BE92|nr:hypothetical protein [Streptomyces sp. WAC 05379]RSO09915.1 hypothetical protein DMH26_00580 [Streptomyces sp. WAC 05379]
MKTRTAVCSALLALAALTGCSSNTEADPAACKAAMEKQFAEAIASGKEGSRPDACDGIDDKTLQKLAGEVVGDQTSKELEKSLDDIEASIDAGLEDLETSAP